MSETLLSSLTKECFKDCKFTNQQIKIAGRYLKDKNLSQNQAKEKAKKFLEECVAKQGKTPFNFKPPAKCFVVDSSKPLSDLEIVKCSNTIQKHIYNATKSDIDSWSGKTGDKYPKKLKAKAEHIKWFAETGISVEYLQVQPLNLIFSHAIQRYLGVILRQENSNKKKKERALKRSKNFVETSAFDDAGCLVQKPGVNPNIYCVSDFSIKPLTKKIIENIDCKESIKQNYNLDPDSPLPIYGFNDRMNIPEGKPGFIPEWQRKFVKKYKRTKKYTPSTSLDIENSLLVFIDIRGSDDWVICDIRGLLRNARYRKLLNKDASINDLLDLFTKDPVIDSNTGEVTFSYVEGIVPVLSKKTLKYKKTKEYIDSLDLSIKDNCVILSIDLGVINPYSFALFNIRDDLKLEDSYKNSGTISKHKELIKKINEKLDEVEERIINQAKLELSKAQQEEFLSVSKDSPDSVKNRLLLDYDIDVSQIDWDSMTSNSTFISDYLVSNGYFDTDIHFEVTKSKTGKELKTPKRYKKKDIWWFNYYKLKVPQKIRDIYNEKLWNIKRESKDYLAISKRRLETARSIVNDLVKISKELSGKDNVIIAIEDIKPDNKDFSGKGKREKGWDNFFNRKKEGRWFIQPLMKALSEQSEHHGIQVLEVNKSFTSQTCPNCGFCSEHNRSKDNRENFQCLRCNKIYNSDIDVATFNIAKLAISGEKLPAPPKKESPTQALARASVVRKPSDPLAGKENLMKSMV